MYAGGMDGTSRAHRGRGAAHNPVNRFTRIEVELDPAEVTDEDLKRPTVYLDDTSRSVISRNQSPDIGFDASVNPYRGCESGCSYCYARPSHEFFGLSAGLDFERIIFVKRRAAELLEAELGAKAWRPQVLALSGVTDPYQVVESKLRITRSVLEVLARYRNPVSVITKRATLTRDLDLFERLHAFGGVFVTLSVTSLDPQIQRAMEPRASAPAARLAAIRALADAGIPVGVNVAPIVPGLTDHEVPAILEAAAEAGAVRASMVMLRLPGTVQDVFVEWLTRTFPLRSERVLARIREMRGGALNDPRFGHRMRGAGPYAEQIRTLFRLRSRQLGLEREIELNADAFHVPGVRQPSLF